MKPDEIKLPDNGEIAIVIYVFKKNLEEKREPVPQAGGNGPGNGKKEPKKPDAEKPAEPMTDPQKSYLFRLLAEQGMEGDDAYSYLKILFGVENLKEVSKSEASSAIQELINNKN